VVVVGADRGEQIADMVVVEPVEGVPPGAADRDQARLPKEPQLLRRSARSHPSRRDEFFDSASRIAQSRRRRLAVPKARIASASVSASSVASGNGFFPRHPKAITDEGVQAACGA
jgi:hypothetical protein